MPTRPLRINFAYPSSAQYTGGVVVLYEFANALARRGHDVRFLHGPAWPMRIDRIEELSWFTFEPSVRHFVVDSFDDPAIPEGDVIMAADKPARLGHQASFIQGARMMDAELERAGFQVPGPKFCVATWLLDEAATYGVPADQLCYTPVGIDRELFRVRTPLEERPVDVAVLYNKHPAKGWDVALKVLRRVRNEHRPDLTVQVFGILEPEDELPRWMRFDLGRDRQFLAEKLYGKAKVFLQTSHWEGLGLTAIEAMASGCALVTTDNGGSQDYSIRNETALISPPGAVLRLAANVEALLADDARRIAMARAGEAFVDRVFDWDRSAARMEAVLQAYVAEPIRFQAPPFSAVPPEGEPRAAVVPSTLPTLDPSTLRSADVVFNIVWTGVVFKLLRWFTASLLRHSDAKYRFVCNGCTPEQIEELRAYQRAHADRVVEVLDVSPVMVAHGVALDAVRRIRDDGPLFGLMDPDIKATAPFVDDLLALLEGNVVVTSGTEVWAVDSYVPENHPGVSGEYFLTRDGFVFGSPHLAIYDRAAMEATSARWGVGMGSAGPDLPPEAKARMRELGHGYLMYDTCKILNALLQADGKGLVHRDLDQLVHIGGLAHFISPTEYRINDDGEQEPDWGGFDNVRTRYEFARFTARTMDALIGGTTPPPLPTGLDDEGQRRIERVRDEIVDLVANYDPT